MKTETTQLRTDIYYALIFSTLVLALSFSSTLIGMLLAIPFAVVIGFFIGWLDAPVWGRIALGMSAVTGFIAALLVRGTQGVFLHIAVLLICILLGALIGIARGGTTHDK